MRSHPNKYIIIMVCKYCEREKDEELGEQWEGLSLRLARVGGIGSDLRKWRPVVAVCYDQRVTTRAKGGARPSPQLCRPQETGLRVITHPFPGRSLISLMGTAPQLPPRVAAVITPSSSWSLATSPALPPCPWHLPSLRARPAVKNIGVPLRSWHPSPATKVS